MSSMGACGGIEALHKLSHPLLVRSQPPEMQQVRRLTDELE
jgi:hypothetical protein